LIKISINIKSQVKDILKFEDFENSMKGIFSTSVNKNTIDESPMTYKDADLIENLIEPTAKVLFKIKPVINLKASEEEPSWRKKKKIGSKVNEKYLKFEIICGENTCFSKAGEWCQYLRWNAFFGDNGDCILFGKVFENTDGWLQRHKECKENTNKGE